MNFEIIKLTKKDLTLAKQSISLFLDSNEMVSDDKVLENLLGKEIFYFVVALCESNPVGRLIAYEFNLYKNNAKEVYLYEIDVLETHQNR